MTRRNLNTLGRVVMVLGVCAGLAFLILALVIFIQEHDWPAKYISIGVGILAATFIAFRRRAALRERQ
ncbi:MAG: hypothetical protein ABJB97_07480 [Acidobacteriota bacterium]